MSVLEWMGRVIMLVLAGMITLSIIGAIAAIPSGSNLPRQIGIERTPAPEPPTVPPQEQQAPEVTSDPGDAVAPAPGAKAGTTLAPAFPKPVDHSEWLEVIAYALLALAGLGALGIVLLWRSLAQHGRIADALEAFASLPPGSSARTRSGSTLPELIE